MCIFPKSLINFPNLKIISRRHTNTDASFSERCNFLIISHLKIDKSPKNKTRNSFVIYGIFCYVYEEMRNRNGKFIKLREEFAGVLDYCSVYKTYNPEQKQPISAAARQTAATVQ